MNLRVQRNDVIPEYLPVQDICLRIAQLSTEVMQLKNEHDELKNEYNELETKYYELRTKCELKHELLDDWISTMEGRFNNRILKIESALKKRFFVKLKRLLGKKDDEKSDT